MKYFLNMCQKKKIKNEIKKNKKENPFGILKNLNLN